MILIIKVRSSTSHKNSVLTFVLTGKNTHISTDFDKYFYEGYKQCWGAGAIKKLLKIAPDSQAFLEWFRAGPGTGKIDL